MLPVPDFMDSFRVPDQDVPEGRPLSLKVTAYVLGGGEVFFMVIVEELVAVLPFRWAVTVRLTTPAAEFAVKST